MKLNSRQIEVIRFLLNKNDYVTIETISNAFKMSERTIRNDLHVIKDYLKDKDIVLELSSGKGCRIIATNAQVSDIETGLNDDRICSDNEYIELIFDLLLCFDDCTYDSIAEYCLISKSKIISYMNDIEELANKNNLSLVKEKGKGIYLFGDEQSFRKAYSKKLLDNDLIPHASLELANTAIQEVEKQLNIQYYNHDCVQKIVAYSLYRISCGKNINTETKAPSDYIKALNCFPISEYEKQFIASIMCGFKHHEVDKSLEDSEAKEIALYLVDRLQELHNIDDVARAKLIDGLTIHLKVALYRIYNDLPIENELVNQIKLTIPLVYEYTRTSLLACERKYNIRFEEGEIAYVAMYIGSTYESSIAIDTKIKVLLVCSFGTATSSILKTRITQTMPDCIVEGPFSYEDALKYITYNKVDLAISTSFDSLGGIPVIKVNPLLNSSEIDAIRNQIFQISYAKMCQSFLSSFSKKNVDLHYVKDLIPRDNIQIVESVDNWEKAIQLSASPLLKKNLIEQRYVDGMINAVNELGTYMVLVDETAFVHAGTNDGIMSDCISFLNLKKPVIFGNNNSKLVRNIIVLGIKNRENKDALNIVNILAKSDNLDLLKSDIKIEQILDMHD